MAENNSLTAGPGTFANNYQPGNEADFERLYQASYGKILGTLTALLGDRAAAEDCAQDAFERAYKKWATWQPIAPAEASAARASLPILRCSRRTATWWQRSPSCRQSRPR